MPVKNILSSVRCLLKRFLVLCLMLGWVVPLCAQSNTDQSVKSLLSFFNTLAVYNEDTEAQQTLSDLSTLYQQGTAIGQLFSGNSLRVSLNENGQGGAKTAVNAIGSDDPAVQQLQRSVAVIEQTGGVIDQAISTKSMSAVTVNESALGLLNDIAGYTNNPKIKNLTTDLNQLHQGMADIKNNITENFGADAISNEAAAITEGVFAAFYIIDALFTKKEPTPGQKLTQSYLQKSEAEVKKIYAQRTTLPELKVYDKKVMTFLESRERYLDQYDLATAQQRLLLLRFRYSGLKDIPEPEVIATWWNQITRDFSEKGLNYIKSEVSRYVNSNTPLYLQNSEESLLGVRNEILLYKIQYHYKTGNDALAMQLTDSMAMQSSYDEKKNAIDQAFAVRNYKMAAQLYPVFFSHWYKAVNKLLYDEEFQKDKSKESFANYIYNGFFTIGKGITALAKNGQYTNAAQHLEQLNSLYYAFLNRPVKKGKNSGITFSFSEKGAEKMYFLYAESEILKQKQQYDVAMTKLDSARLFYAQTTNKESAFLSVLMESKIDLLIYQKRFNEALSEVVTLQQTFSVGYDVARVKFLQALVYYNMGKYQPALGSINLAKSFNDKTAEYYALERSIHLAMKNPELADKAYQKIISLSNP